MSQQKLLPLRDRLADAACDAAAVAAAFIREHADRSHALDWRTKRRADFVSDVDTGAEERIASVLLSRVPGATIVGEELSPGVSLQSGVAFIVDPLDGTTNFLHGYPQYAVSIGVMLDGVLIGGVVHDVARDHVYRAVLQRGATCNGNPIHVSGIDTPARALVGTGFPFKNPELLPEYQLQFARVLGASSGIRRAGAAALDLCDVACGRFDAFWELVLAPWDMAAGTLIVREAGGQVTDLVGQPVAPYSGPLVASNGLLHEWILATLASD